MKLRPWLRALAECFPALRLGPLALLWERLDELGPGGSWEAGVPASEGFPLIRLRYRLSEKSFDSIRTSGARGTSRFDAWAAAAARLCGIGAPAVQGRPPAGFPWFEAVWDCRKGELAATTFFGAGAPGACLQTSGARWTSAVCRTKGGGEETVLLRESVFRPALWRSAGLERAFADFSALVPVRCLISEALRDSSGLLRPRHAWALSLRRPVPWPLFLRLDLTAPFSAQASQLALLFPDLAVVELALRDETLWAYFKA